MHYFLIILTSGLLAGLMYAMVAIGFVLIYKASGVFNFAQGSMVLFAALTFVMLNEHGLPFWARFPGHRRRHGRRRRADRAAGAASAGRTAARSRCSWRRSA